MLNIEARRAPERKDFQPDLLIHPGNNFQCTCPITGEQITAEHQGFGVTPTGKLALKYAAPGSPSCFVDRIENIRDIRDISGNKTTFAIKMEKNDEYWAYARVCQENGERYVQAIQCEEIGGYVHIIPKRVSEVVVIALNVS